MVRKAGTDTFLILAWFVFCRKTADGAPCPCAAPSLWAKRRGHGCAQPASSSRCLAVSWGQQGLVNRALRVGESLGCGAPGGNQKSGCLRWCWHRRDAVCFAVVFFSLLLEVGGGGAGEREVGCGALALGILGNLL
jgi:hypothetical protein